jgi:hypothetical protein
MKDVKCDQKDFSTCLEEVSFAETMQKRTERLDTDSRTSQFPDSHVLMSVRPKSKSRKQAMVESIFNLHPCATCPIRCRAVANPNSLFARIHRWHKTWWPGWKIYQAGLHLSPIRSTTNSRTVMGKEN